MRHRTLLVASLALTLPLFAGGVRANDDDNDDNGDGRAKRSFRASLAGANEVPPISTGASGRLRLSINREGTEIAFTLSWTNLAADAAAAHIHFGPTKVNGGVMVFFCGGGGQPACPVGGTLAAGDRATVTGTIAAANVVGPAGQGIAVAEFAKVLQAVRNGQGYANVHNARFPGGEIRGQVVD